MDNAAADNAAAADNSNTPEAAESDDMDINDTEEH